MRWLKIGLGVVAVVVGVLAVGAGGAWAWSGAKVDGILDQSWETHDLDFPIPFPLSEAEIADLRAQKLAELPPASADAPPADPLAGVDLAAIALERAQERGKHDVTAIFVCAGCHGATFGGGKMIDDPAIGKWLAPNITIGGKTPKFTARDWDRAVRHGVLPDGKTSIMPVGDFKQLSDHELSDIVAYIRSLPPQSGGETVRDMGPIGRMLIASGKLVPDVYKVDHQAPHPVEPPPAGETVEYGKHVTSVCVGCHRDDLRGGPMPFGPPDWPPAANLTPSEQGTKGWTYDDFVAAFKQGKKHDGTAMRVPMSEILAYTVNWNETETKAAWMYLQSLPPQPTGE